MDIIIIMVLHPGQQSWQEAKTQRTKCFPKISLCMWPCLTLKADPTESLRKSCLLLQKGWPISYTPAEMLPNPTCSCRNVDQSCSLLHKVWLIPTTPLERVTSIIHTGRKFDQPHPLLQKGWPSFTLLQKGWPIPSTVTEMLTNFLHSCRKFD